MVIFMRKSLLKSLWFHQGRGRTQGVEAQKTLYGLHQTPRAWNEKLNNTLVTFGLCKCPFEPAIYTRSRGKHQLVIGVYVDDIVVTGNNSEGIKHFKTEMADAFSMNDLGLLHYYLGIEVRQDAHGISLN
jgi:hypothetical protein